MRWAVMGAGGMLGSDAVKVLRAAGEDVTGFVRSDLEGMPLPDLQPMLYPFDVVLNCIAWTDVDGAQDHMREAHYANAVIPEILANALPPHTLMVQVSTDYVFSGERFQPYAEDTPLNPLSMYGITKSIGEVYVRSIRPDNHLVVRTAWLYGANGRCFPKTITHLTQELGNISVVNDQWGQPTWTCDVVDLIRRLVRAGVPVGTYHATSRGEATWFEFAQRVVASQGLAAECVHPCTSAEFPRPAPRPAYSVLGNARLAEVGVKPIGHWADRWDTFVAQHSFIEPGRDTR